MRTKTSVGIAAAILVALQGLPAFAHTQVADSNPQDGATVDAAPEEVWVKFGSVPPPGEQPMAINGGVLEVFDACGEQVSSGETEMNQLQNQLTVASDGNRAGRYEIIWTVEASDGEAQAGLIDFNVTEGSGCDYIARRDSLKDVDEGLDIKSVKATPLGDTTKIQVKLKKPINCKALGARSDNGLGLSFDRNADDADDYTGSFGCKNGKFKLALTEAGDDVVIKSYRATLTPKGNVLTTKVKTADLGDGDHLDLYATSNSEADECDEEPAEGETAPVCADRAPDLGVLRVN